MNGTRFRAVLAALISLLTCLLVVPASAATEYASQAKTPILFVHGWNGGGWNWDSMAGKFKNDGWPANYLDQWNYDTHQSNVDTAKQLADEVNKLKAATGASKVDIVSHSMGGLSSRYYLKNMMGTGNVDRWVSLGGPNHGTTSANSCVDTSCVEMRPNSDFLNALNASDETPGSSVYATWWSPCDEIINPHESVKLTGAANTQTGCLGHLMLLSDDTVYGQVRNFVGQ